MHWNHTDVGIPAPSTRIAVAVDSELFDERDLYSDRAYYVDYVIPIIDSLKRRFQEVAVVPVKNGHGAVDALRDLQAFNPELVFNTAFSAVAEEASFVGTLELLGLRYTGASMMGLLLASDKLKCCHLLSSQGIRVPAGIIVDPHFAGDLPILSYPIIVKPALYGAASRGIYADSVVNGPRGLIRNVKRLWSNSYGPALCQEFIIGREFRLSVIKGAGSAIHIVGVSECSFPRARPGWGYKTRALRSSQAACKANGVSSAALIPPADLQARLSGLAVNALNAMDIQGPATLDLRMMENGTLVLIEVNANPGLTPKSDIWSSPSFDENILRIVAEALSR